MTDPQPPSNWSDPTRPPAQPSGPGPAEPPTSQVRGPYPTPEYQDGSYPVPPALPVTPAEPSYAQTAYDPAYGQPPYGQAGYQAGYGYGAGGYAVYPAAPPTNGLAIASMIVSIIGFGPVGAIMGHIARKQIQERGEQGDGFALAGIIVGWVTTGIWVLCCGFYALLLAGMFGTAGLSSL